MNLATQTSVETKLSYPAFYNEMEELPFELVYIPSLDHLLLFQTGSFDQILYVQPHNGAAATAAAAANRA
jgi:hypothetical protein